jgi:23S rRNA pseudouridine1911/1915/1917 synthase
VTEFAVLEHFGRASLLSVRILTGRTHQIRVHLASIGHPVVGDSTYGHAKANAEFGIARQALHAAKLSFTHPATGERVEYEAPLPADFENELVRLRKSRLIKKPPNT